MCKVKKKNSPIHLPDSTYDMMTKMSIRAELQLDEEMRLMWTIPHDITSLSIFMSGICSSSLDKDTKLEHFMIFKLLRDNRC